MTNSQGKKMMEPSESPSGYVNESTDDSVPLISPEDQQKIESEKEELSFM